MKLRYAYASGPRHIPFDHELIQQSPYQLLQIVSLCVGIVIIYS